ncbi:MAG: cupin domain-containing protein [Bacteroidetes bacterium]|nr:cupin domain-containing protein [Bacteroidota bacterium]
MKKLFCIIMLVLLISGHIFAEETGTTKVEELAKSSLSWNWGSLPEYPDGTPEITILRITIPPNVKLPLHMHPVINAGVLLSGELTVVTEDNDILHLKAGEAIIEVVNTWHYGINEGTEPAVIIVFYAGVVGQPITIKENTE